MIIDSSNVQVTVHFQLLSLLTFQIYFTICVWLRIMMSLTLSKTAHVDMYALRTIDNPISIN